MARIELSNIGGGTTLSLTTTGTSGAATLVGSVLNIPVYQGQLTLTTTGTSGAATLAGDILNIPNYATGGNPAGAAGQVQFNSTPAGSFAASANLAWDNTAVQLNINTPLSPTGKLNVKGSGATSSTVNTRLTDSGNTELLKVLDNGSTNIGANFNWDNVNGRLGLGTSTPNQTLEVSGAMRLTGTAGTAAFMLGRSSAGDVSTVTLGTTGTSGAATLSANVLNIPQYQGALTLTTTGTSGAATLVGNTLNIPQYSGGGGTPAGSTGEIQYNNAGAFAASSNLAWDNTNVRLNIGAPSSPTGRLNVKGGGATSSTVNLRLTDSGNTELVKVLDNGSTNIGTAFNWDNTNSRLGLGSSSPGTLLVMRAASPAQSFFSTGMSPASPFTGVAPWANGEYIGVVGQAFAASGGMVLQGFTNSDNRAFTFQGNIGSTAPTASAVVFQGNKSNGSTGRADLSGTETIAMFQTGITAGVGIAMAVRANATVNVGGDFTPSATVHVRGSNTSSGTNAFLVQNSTPSDIYKIENNGKISYLATNTAAGTTGAQTINRPSGTVNFAAGASALVVTNSLCTTASLVFAEVRTNDATAQIKNVVPAGGSFTINLSAAATAETSVGFFIIN